MAYKTHARTSKATRSFAFRAPTWWNDLPSKIRTAKTATECREAVYRHLLKQENDQLLHREAMRALGKEPVVIRGSTSKEGSSYVYLPFA